MMPFQSVFDCQFDVVVYGGGYAGVAAALASAKAGSKTLLLHRSMSLLWESGLAFSSVAADSDCPQWKAFTAPLSRRRLYRDGLLDCVAAEVFLCKHLKSGAADGLHLLLGVSPVSTSFTTEGICESLTVATKAGSRTIRAARWIDTSEEATLWQLATEALKADKRRERSAHNADACTGFAGHSALRHPLHVEQRVVLYGVDTAATVPTAVAEAAAEVRLEPRLWQNEVTLCFVSKEPLSLAELSARTARVRDTLSPAKAGEPPVVVAIGEAPLPVYDHTGSSQSATAGSATVDKIHAHGNVVFASPRLCAAATATLADRFGLGIAAAGESNRQAASAPATQTAAAADRVTVSLPQVSLDCDVLVAGGGSAGMTAALASARSGARTVVVDSMPSAGGTATQGLIFRYFHGQPGGLFEQLDAQAAQLKETDLAPGKVLFGGINHPEAKKIAFEQSLSDSGQGQFIGGAIVFGADVSNGTVTCAYAAAADRIYALRAKSVIDATADGDLCALSGASYQMGRRGDGLPLAYSQTSLGIVPAPQGEGPRLRCANFDAGRVDGTDPEDLTRARVTAVALLEALLWEQDSHLLTIAPLIGVRQSRHIDTHQKLTLDDMIRHKRFDNAIGWIRSPLDTHSVDYEFEDDPMLFWLWGCKHFRGMTCSQMPYGALVPKGLHNVWIACRASGMSVSAAYGARMVRDMQRIGEAAGYAAAQAAQLGCAAIDVPMETWRDQLLQSGAMQPYATVDAWNDSLLEQLDEGNPAGYLWTLYSDRDSYGNAVLERLPHTDPNVSWLAAVVLAMWADPRAEQRLLQAISAKEKGVPTPRAALGAHSQWIDVPNWFLAISLLRICGTARCLPALLELAQERSSFLNLRTSLALTVERLAPRITAASTQAETGQARELAQRILEALAAEPLPETYLRPSRSYYRTLYGEAQLPLPNEPENVDTREDHLWQLWLVLWRAGKAWGLAPVVDITAMQADSRALVRRAFRQHPA